MFARKSHAVYPLVSLFLAFASVSSSFAAASSFVALRVEFDRTTYRPGQMVVARAKMVNLISEPIVLRAPHSEKLPAKSNLHFHLRRVGDSDVLRRAPIMIRRGVSPKTLRLEPGQSVEESFAFVNLTETTGTYKVFTEYIGVVLTEKELRAGETAKREKPALISCLATYSVAGARLFKRGPGGMISKENAIGVARKKYRKPVIEARAVLIETTSDLFDWWVTLRRAPADTPPGASDLIAYHISPYGGFARRETTPFSLDPKEFQKMTAGGNTIRKAAEPSASRVAAPPRGTINK